MIRIVRPDDAKAIAAIYNYYVLHTVVTFEEEPVSDVEMCRRIEMISKCYPFLVMEEQGEVLGYAYATAWKPRSAYRFTAENTIYLKPGMEGKGLGSILFKSFLTEVDKTELHLLVAGIALPNEASVALHEKFGFKPVGTFTDIGYKHNKWVDVGYWELKLEK